MNPLFKLFKIEDPFLEFDQNVKKYGFSSGCTTLVRELGLNIKVDLEKFPHHGAVLVYSNHPTGLDPFILGGVLGRDDYIFLGDEYQTKKGKNVLYITSERFINDVVWAIRNKRMEDIKKKYRDVDVLIIDDIQFIGGKEKTEEEFFHTFNALYENNKQIIISSDRPPQSIPTLEERLRSRFEGGLIADIVYPEYEMRVAIIKSKLQESNRELSEQIINIVINYYVRNSSVRKSYTFVCKCHPITRGC